MPTARISLNSLFSSVSDPSSNDAAGTLYDPPLAESTAPSSGDETVPLQLSLSENRIERLQAVAEQLGLTPSTLAKRAIEMICDEVVTIQNDERSPSVLVEQYQARIDLLHSINEADETSESENSDDDDSSDEDE